MIGSTSTSTSTSRRRKRRVRTSMKYEYGTSYEYTTLEHAPSLWWSSFLLSAFCSWWGSHSLESGVDSLVSSPWREMTTEYAWGNFSQSHSTSINVFMQLLTHSSLQSPLSYNIFGLLSKLRRTLDSDFWIPECWMLNVECWIQWIWTDPHPNWSLSRVTSMT
jgi:hypothetical protein